MMNPTSTCTAIGLTLGALLLSCNAVAAPQNADMTPAKALEQCPVAAYAMALRYQQSPEVRALQRQAWSLARLRLQQALANSDKAPSRLAVVTDLDETVIDNSALLIRDMQNCHTYSGWDTWSNWEREGTPKLIPGAKAFLDYANEQGVAIYYISDRFQENEPATLATLKQLGLPQVTEDSVKLYGLSKEERRAKVKQNHEIVLMMGDTLHDFASLFDDDDLDRQYEGVASNAEKFGDRWIVFPNATYGDWSTLPLQGWDHPADYASDQSSDS
ncbi:5'-nucleotidase, lipoprotein e(P4) family [Kushneria aurantia]|uniref:5'-nucleotidase, lipoprotein e(P4) family n=1 Tax=Kushneria aurantia TaxID=504092 RepID=A0ABV6FYP2_9GAMM|nr:HAD family acid phosphatase [Kushneria aurantia]